MKVFIVQTCDGYYTNGVSYHTTQYGADWACAHEMELCFEDDNEFEAEKFQIIERELEL